ncbi:MAG: YDG/SRA domain-containing protein [Myxococcales bacterium]|nr:YDG/SRA domain-containing protein [Myxococcales bacterium]
MDDEDHGDEVIYTGEGGHDPNTGRQMADQELKGGNLALARSADTGIPVRVIRQVARRTRHSASKYRYDGLFKVTDCWHVKSQHDLLVYRYRLLRLDDATPRRCSVRSRRLRRRRASTGLERSPCRTWSAASS